MNTKIQNKQWACHSSLHNSIPAIQSFAMDVPTQREELEKHHTYLRYCTRIKKSPSLSHLKLLLEGSPVDFHEALARGRPEACDKTSVIESITGLNLLSNYTLSLFFNFYLKWTTRSFPFKLLVLIVLFTYKTVVFILVLLFCCSCTGFPILVTILLIKFISNNNFFQFISVELKSLMPTSESLCLIFTLIFLFAVLCFILSEMAQFIEIAIDEAINTYELEVNTILQNSGAINRPQNLYITDLENQGNIRRNSGNAGDGNPVLGPLLNEADRNDQGQDGHQHQDQHQDQGQDQDQGA